MNAPRFVFHWRSCAAAAGAPGDYEEPFVVFSGLSVRNVAERLGIKPQHADGTTVGGVSFRIPAAVSDIGAREPAVQRLLQRLTACGKLASMPDPRLYPKAVCRADWRA